MNKHLNSIIIDDEKHSRETLQEMLVRYCRIATIGEADGVESGIEAIENLKPNLVFLDIKMNDGTGFDLLRKINNRNFHVIFTTAYDQYAINAIRFSALDYLLKPIDIEELKAAVDRAKSAIEEDDIPETNQKMDVLIHNTQSNDKLQKIVLSTSEGMHIVDVKNIIRCEADDYYTHIYIEGQKSIMISRTLKEIESSLSGSDFIRTHKSHLVNLSYIKTYVKSDGGYLILKNGENVPVSRRKKEMMGKVLASL
ncbi:MAG: response regulator transcription factor [Bacteroidales bacterium]|nr:response regulator transcription factor [Bacteroidales bacterium]